MKIHAIDPDREAKVSLCNNIITKDDPGTHQKDLVTCEDCQAEIQKIQEEVKKTRALKEEEQRKKNTKNIIERAKQREEKDRELFEKLYWDCVPTKEIAKIFGITRASVRYRVKKAGLPELRKRHETIAKQMIAEGKTIKETNEKTRISATRLSIWKREYDLEHNPEEYKEKICIECGKTYKATHGTNRQCLPCLKEKYTKKTAIHFIRTEYTQLHRKNPEAAEQLVHQMETMEGHKFREYALNGLPEKFKKEKEEDE